MKRDKGGKVDTQLIIELTGLSMMPIFTKLPYLCNSDKNYHYKLRATNKMYFAITYIRMYYDIHYINSIETVLYTVLNQW